MVLMSRFVSALRHSREDGVGFCRCLRKTSAIPSEASPGISVLSFMGVRGIMVVSVFVWASISSSAVRDVCLHDQNISVSNWCTP